MNESTHEQVTADEAMRNALVRVRAAYADEDDREAAVLVDWTAVAAFSDGNGGTFYYLSLTDGECPEYRALGLLAEGRDLLMNHQRDKDG